MNTQIVMILNLCIMTDHFPFLNQCRILLVPAKNDAHCIERIKYSTQKDHFAQYFKGEGHVGEEVLAAPPHCETLHNVNPIADNDYAK